jgi:hypothetical protein
MPLWLPQQSGYSRSMSDQPFQCAVFTRSLERSVAPGATVTYGRSSLDHAKASFRAILTRRPITLFMRTIEGDRPYNHYIINHET